MKLKNVKLVLLQCDINSIKIGSYYIGQNDKLYLILDKVELYTQAANNGKIRLVQPYLISNDIVALGDLRYSTKTNELSVQPLLDLYSPEQIHYLKVIAQPESIGVSFEDLQQIYYNEGKCKIELNDDYSIKLIDNKVILLTTNQLTNN